ncbi:MAG: glucose dehydrogenase, partial [Chloroflexi bacterium]
MTHPSGRRSARRLALFIGAAVLFAGCVAGSPSPSLPTASPSAVVPESVAPSVAPSLTPSEPPPPLASGPDSVTLQPVTSGLDRPLGVENAGDGSGRLFVVEQNGQIHAISASGELDPDPFLDISSLVLAGGERGLLGLAFHPDYGQNRRFFVAYTSRPSGANTVAEYRVSQDPARADPASGRILFAVPDPAANHNGGSLAFGPDGYLYIAMGDGGGQNDQFGNGQNLNSLLAKILRIDVDAAPAAGRTYAIPPANPFAGGGGAPEIWAYGVRNPWRITFDRALGELFMGDVGGGAWEE